MKKQFHMTQDGINELQNELDTLISERSGIADRIRIAREQGDLSENAEYSAAKDEQERTESRIAELQGILKNVKLIKKPKGDSKVQLGSTVLLKGETGTKKEFQVVGTVEADPLNGKISDESPIGQALMGKAEGQEVEIKTPAETAVYTIADIS